MAGAVQRKQPSLSIPAFRSWLETRPDEEHWELIDGIPMRVTPRTIVHQRIASNIERLLNDALEQARPTMAAYQRVGLNLGGRVENYDPEPDVAVIDVAQPLEARYADRFYLVVEIVSSSDAPKIEGKREVYKLQPNCKRILTVQQDRMEVRVDTRDADSWTTTVLANANDELALTDFGLRCRLSDVYRGTPLQPRITRGA